MQYQEIFCFVAEKTGHFIDAVANVSIDDVVVVVVSDDVIVVVDDAIVVVVVDVAVVEPLKLQIDKIYDFRLVIVFFLLLPHQVKSRIFSTSWITTLVPQSQYPFAIFLSPLSLSLSLLSCSLFLLSHHSLPLSLSRTQARPR